MKLHHLPQNKLATQYAKLKTQAASSMPARTFSRIHNVLSKLTYFGIVVILLVSMLLFFGLVNKYFIGSPVVESQEITNLLASYDADLQAIAYLNFWLFVVYVWLQIVVQYRLPIPMRLT